MSCLGVNYNPYPTRTWSRIDNIISTNISPEKAYEIEVQKKGIILQYKKNSANLTKNQKYAQIAKRIIPNYIKPCQPLKKVEPN